MYSNVKIIYVNLGTRSCLELLYTPKIATEIGLLKHKGYHSECTAFINKKQKNVENSKH